MTNPSGPATAADRPVSRCRGPALLAVGLLALGALIFTVLRLADLEAFGRTVTQARPLWLLAAAALQVTTYVSVAQGWALVLGKAGWPCGIRRLLPIAVSKLFADQVLPTAGMGGNVLLVERLRSLGCPRGIAVAALLVSMVGFYTVYAALALVMLVLLWLHHAATPLLVGLVTSFLLVALAIPTLALWLRGRGSKPLRGAIERLPPIADLLRILSEAPRALVLDRRLIVRVAICNGMIFLADAATLMVCLWSLGQPVGYATAFIAHVSASIAVTLAPLPLGLGSFDASCTAMLSLLGVPLAAALAGTLLLRGFTLWLPLVPGLLLVRRAAAPSRGSAVPPARRSGIG